ncbi:sigma-54-dependent Fis family transcriptional regulator [Clostridium botulinum]|uniref:Sigma-54-dependent Fis family transcriptional regulator n=1 Tax=Clostridium botulinum TaxID=1491 RepID=A0A846JF81_CLOBO|nr:sigma-54-dependent Fis family transcriptional regulator [Clostridium botulinum]ACA55068.1 aor transcriptional regulator [Clostridium botulinum A3 str. Loch Maree]NFH65785.1 sigma-54-dependent Fis family transcriptional regulator [Clostridium botulinum]NFJ08655.1 sigma-54-dependent Fis family transcriptional regulator [Clostridium botulinum]NFK15051.1 sigma-54-dependent Fis family transcriptional regulator [Clostridium botulinum]NFM93012.1 sigma-54-dependent Fis family transcriptional regula
MKDNFINEKFCILKSHEKCNSLGISKDLVYSKKIIKDEELKRELNNNSELIIIATPFMNKLYQFVKGSNFFVILTDGDGCILNVIGDESILKEAFNVKMIPGAYMDEKNMGTNAMSMALSEKSPIQISGEDHYVKAYHRWTCSAAPIKDINGKIIGILDLTGYSENVHSHTLGMVAAATNAIEKMIELNNYNRALQISKKSIENVFNSIQRAILRVDLSGAIKTINNNAIELLGFNENDIKSMKMWDLIPDWSMVLDEIYDKGSFVDEDVYVHCLKNKLQLNLSAYPIYDSSMRIIEVTCLLSDIQKTRKLAGKILSGQAIYTFDKIIGKSKKLLSIIDYSKKIADSRSTILITGDSGTGKEVFAQSIHNYSDRKDKPFIAVNCGAIPRNLIESELFGYEEGAFTGAKRGGYRGKFENSHGGTIFLDEIGEMPLDMQIKLLRVIEEGVINRIGSSKQIPVNSRIIAATNKDLRKEVEKGNFRKDLFYRINVLPVYLPALKERREDIPLLIDYFMNKTSKHLNKRKVEIPSVYMERLMNYDWPGNIRELENIVELIINAESVEIINNINHHSSKEVRDKEKEETMVFNLEIVEKNHIKEVLNKFDGNVSSAARALGIGRNTLYRKIEKYSLY